MSWGRETIAVLEESIHVRMEHVRSIIMYDTLSEGKHNDNYVYITSFFCLNQPVQQVDYMYWHSCIQRTAMHIHSHTFIHLLSSTAVRFCLPQ